jgi:hypothetical protein
LVPAVNPFTGKAIVIHVCVYNDVHTPLYACMCAVNPFTGKAIIDVHIYICVHIDVHIYICVHIDVHVYIYIYIYMYVY